MIGVWPTELVRRRYVEKADEVYRLQPDAWWVDVWEFTRLVEAGLHTGRTHQLRVHFQYIGFPIAGDETYGASQTKKLAAATGYTPPRVLLHAHKLSFLHPRSGRVLGFQPVVV